MQASKKRGLSLDDKRAKLLEASARRGTGTAQVFSPLHACMLCAQSLPPPSSQVFHESRDVYVLKDIEKLGVKKGIVLQSIKEVLQASGGEKVLPKPRVSAMHACAMARTSPLLAFFPRTSPSSSFPSLHSPLTQSLVDDDMAKMEKIGSANYYWSFPSEASVKVEMALRAAQESLANVKKQKQETQRAIDSAKQGKEISVRPGEPLLTLHSGLLHSPAGS
jgi:hypothetical protein